VEYHEKGPSLQNANHAERVEDGQYIVHLAKDRARFAERVVLEVSNAGSGFQKNDRLVPYP